jgi:hypothetical protein
MPRRVRGILYRNAKEPKTGMKNLKRKPQEETIPQPDPLLTPEVLERQRHAGDLVRAWMKEQDGYDEEIWPLLEQALRR